MCALGNEVEGDGLWLWYLKFAQFEKDADALLGGEFCKIFENLWKHVFGQVVHELAGNDGGLVERAFLSATCFFSFWAYFFHNKVTSYHFWQR